MLHNVTKMLLNNIINSKNKVKLVRELSLHESWEYSINELEKETKIHRVRISNLIKELYNYNVIKIRKKGKVSLISINKDNFFVKELLIKIFHKEKEITEKTMTHLVNGLKSKKNIISIVLYGSAVKSDFTFKSDIDLMIIYKNNMDKKQTEKTIQKYTDKGIHISYDFIKLKEFKKLYLEKEASIVTLVKNHKVLYGKKLLEII